MNDLAIRLQLGGEAIQSQAALYFEDEPFDPIPGVYKSTVGGTVFLCYGRAHAHLGKGPDSQIAIVMPLDVYMEDQGDGSYLAIKGREITQFITREQWNDKALLRIGPIQTGMREIGWA